MARGRIGRRTLGLVAVAALAIPGIFAAPSGAATQNPPPGWIDPGGNAWVGFTLDTTAPSPIGRTGYAPVTITRSSSLGGSVELGWFDNWEELDLVPDPSNTIDTRRWPLAWDGPDGLHMVRVEECDYTATSCKYAVEQDGAFWFFGGVPPDGPVPGAPDPNPADWDEGVITLPALPTINIGPLQADPTAGVDGAAGTIRLSAAGTVDQAGMPLTYRWVLIGPRSKIYTSEGPDDFFEITAEMDGEYCVELTVTASDNHSVGTPKCTEPLAARFTATGVAPKKTEAPAPTPGGGGGGTGGGGTGGGGTGGGGGGIPGIGFSNPSGRAPATLTGGTPGASPTVIWLWRPEWFQDTPSTNELPRTDGQPKLTGRADIVVRSPSPKGPSAGPWLAGVGIFGLLGGGWVVSRRRRLRMLAEL